MAGAGPCGRRRPGHPGRGPACRAAAAGPGGEQPELFVDQRQGLRHHRGPTPKWWWVCFAVAVFVASFTVAGLTYLVAVGVGRLGPSQPDQLGLGHRQLRVLDRHRATPAR